jgi:hypothetical protein
MWNVNTVLGHFVNLLFRQPRQNDTRRNGQPPKSQLAKNINHSIWLFYAQVDFLAS